ncbi:MAG: 50S ribosomal protein L21 [Patescibacteria group bacterium]|jgi:large subunit ribosomal protein L21
MFAVISHKGNQYKLEPGKEYLIDLVDGEDGKKTLDFADVLLVSDDKDILIGTPTVPGASVKTEILSEVHGDKVRVFKFAAKKRYKRDLGHRQNYTKIKVLEIKTNEK